MDRLNRVLRNQVRVQGGYGTAAPLPTVLPHWVEKGTNLVYISKSKGDAHSVRVEKIEDRKQMVVIRFEQDHRIWKRVPFAEIRKFGDGTLRPLWKKSEVATVPQKPKDFVDIETEEEEELGMAEAVDPTAEAPEENEDAVVVMGPQLPEIGPQLPTSPELAPKVPVPEVEAEQVILAEEAEAEVALERSNGAVDAGNAAVSRNCSLSEAEDEPREPRDEYRELSPESRARAVAAAAAATALDLAAAADKPKKVKKKRDQPAEVHAKERGKEKDPEGRDKPRGQLKEKGRERAPAKAKAEKRQANALVLKEKDQEAKEKQKGEKKAARPPKASSLTAGNAKTPELGARSAEGRGDQAKAKDRERRDEAKAKDKDNNKERVRRRPPSSSPGRIVPKAGKAPRRH